MATWQLGISIMISQQVTFSYTSLSTGPTLPTLLSIKLLLQNKDRCWWETRHWTWMVHVYRISKPPSTSWSIPVLIFLHSWLMEWTRSSYWIKGKFLSRSQVASRLFLKSLEQEEVLGLVETFSLLRATTAFTCKFSQLSTSQSMACPLWRLSTTPSSNLESSILTWAPYTSRLSSTYLQVQLWTIKRICLSPHKMATFW